MHPLVLRAFEAICADLAVTGRVLEIGASPRHPSLLELPALRAASERVGIGLDGAHDGGHFRIEAGDAHDLSRFADESFELVLCNAMIEHDPRFWLTAAEAKRVAAPGGWLVFGAPAFGPMGSVPGLGLVRRLSRLPLVGRRWRRHLAALEASSLTLGLHDYPGDYYRFSEQAMAEVVLGGLEQVRTRLLLAPPRVIGTGRMPQPEAAATISATAMANMAGRRDSGSFAGTTAANASPSAR